ncbi:hypothetical protein [Streptomyces xanthophaeus]|uniref:hypothetical protein n=1 Tax=Streptomyces xanthophaeus TaxID=67385 RepID=UPI002647DC12|nr:hypothetical protein [Streptomyces xanthophaeus]WKD32509.1 hypothetical protein KO717_11455 [Streptomyces xanthophaeus]
MRLRSTAAVFVGALALALPTAGPSVADDHGERALGTLHYQYLDAAGSERRGQIRPADNDTCYLLTRTSRDEPAIEVRNETESLAVLFDNRSCNGEAEKVLKPGERAKRVEVVSVYFKPVDEEDPGRGDNGGNGGNGGNGTGPGRDDRPRDDEAAEGQTGTNGGNGGNGGNGTWPGRDDQSRDDQTDQTDQTDQSQNQGDGEEEEEDFLTALFRALG